MLSIQRTNVNKNKMRIVKLMFSRLTDQSLLHDCIAIKIIAIKFTIN